MPLWSRIVNLFRGDGLDREIGEEIDSHIAEAIEHGRDPREARRAFGSTLRLREQSRDVRLIGWLDSLRADARYGWRQLAKTKVTSTAAILSLGLAIGACTSAFRLIDALLLRPLPVAGAVRLYALSRQSFGYDGKLNENDACAYPMFLQMRAAVKDQAELIAISYSDRIDLTYGPGQETDRPYRQYVSGWMFNSFGIRPALGRLFTENDDVTPGAHPYAVLAYDYWTRRFGKDPNVVGRTFRTGNELYEILGVAEAPFTGTEPGIVTDIFIPTMMARNNAISRSDYRWFRTFVKLKPGITMSPVRERLRSVFHAFLEESAKAFAGIPKRELDGYLSQTLAVKPAAAGVSGLQKDYGRSLTVLAALVGMVLLIACANVANLMTARGAARAREMALRVSIGAGRWRLVQLVLVECAWLAFLAAALGAVLAWSSAPFVVSAISPADSPVRLILPADWRLLGFGVLVALGVTFLLGLPPAVRASGVKPASALKGGDDPRARQRLMQTLIAAQVAFCFVVLFVAGLFATTFDRLSNQSTGFSAERLLTLETVTQSPKPAVLWEQVADRLRAAPGVERVAISEWPLMTGESWNGFISVDGAPPGEIASYFLSVSSGWMDVMKIRLAAGRDFRPTETLPGAAIVNRTFARQSFGIENPVGKSFEVIANEGSRNRYQIVGLAENARYRDMREPSQPVAYFPFQQNYSRATFIVRTSNRDPLALASALRQEIPRAMAGFHVSAIRTQAELVRSHTIRERLLAMLSMFFATVALLLAGVGLYGVLDYTVLQRRREIGIRMAIGAQAGDIARRVTMDVFAMVLVGTCAGLTIGMVSARFIASLFYQVKPTDMGVLALPWLMILAVALLAAVPAVIRAVRIDPVAMLRAE